MRLEEQLRNLGRGMEDAQVPVSLDEIVHRGSVAGGGDVVGAGRSRGGWVAVVAATVLLLVGLGALAVWTNDSSPITPVDTGTPGATSTTALDADTGASDTVVGDAIVLPDGGMARINSITDDAAVRSELFDRPDSETTLTEIEVERCVGSNSAPLDPTETGSAIPFTMSDIWWMGLLDDGTEVEARPGYWLRFAPVPGGCSRGYLTFKTPAGARLVEVVLSDYRRSEGEPDFSPDPVQQAGRWDVTRSRPVDGPLRPATLPEAVELGEAMDLRLFDRLTATIVEVIDDAEPRARAIDLRDGTAPEPAPDGRKLTELRVQVCRKSTAPDLPDSSISATLDELQWLITTPDNYTGNAGGEAFNGYDPFDLRTGDRRSWHVWLASSFVVDESDRDSGIPWAVQAPAQGGDCKDGAVQIELPEESTPAYAIVAWGPAHYEELGRTRLDS